MFDVAYLQKRLQQPLPGEQAQLRMAHAFRRKLWPAPQEAFHAGVLICFFPKNDEWHLVLIERSSVNKNDRHAGQISFPGGKKDPSDSDIVACALRECYEEVGVRVDPNNCLGMLTPLYIPVSNFLVHPVIAYHTQIPRFEPQIEEVVNIIELPFSHFFDSNNQKHTDILLGTQVQIKDVPYFDAHGKKIWGATAMILSELMALFELEHISLNSYDQIINPSS
jgi:8-oxo-dGTP pyrophosphatase MutT (NUDIX family)